MSHDAQENSTYFDAHDILAARRGKIYMKTGQKSLLQGFKLSYLFPISFSVLYDVGKVYVCVQR